MNKIDSLRNKIQELQNELTKELLVIEKNKESERDINYKIKFYCVEERSTSLVELNTQLRFVYGDGYSRSWSIEEKLKKLHGAEFNDPGEFLFGGSYNMDDIQFDLELIK